MKTIRLIPVLFAAASLLSGCRSEDPMAKFVTAVDVRSFNYVSSPSRTGCVTPDAGYIATFDDNTRKANLTISNLRLSEDDAPTTLEFDNVVWTYKLDVPGKARMIKASQLIPSNTETARGMTLNDVEIVYFEASAADENASEGYYIHYYANGTYEVTAYPYMMQSTGATRVIDESTGEETVDYDAEFTISLNPAAMTASMHASGLDTPVEELKVGGMSLALSNAGFTLSQKNRTEWTTSPLTEGTEISDIEVTAGNDGTLNVDFVLTAADADYRVSAFLYSNLHFTE